MTLGLDTLLKRRLAEVLEETLVDIIVENNFQIVSKSMIRLLMAEEVFSKNGALHKKIKETLGPLPIVSFIKSTLETEIRNHYEYQRGKARLTELARFNDIGLWANKLVDQFNRLPKKYHIVTALGPSLKECFSEIDKRQSFAPSLSLIPGKYLIDEEAPLPIPYRAQQRHIGTSGFRQSASNYFPEWQPDSTYLEFRESGFIGEYGVGHAFVKFNIYFRAFIGLLIAIRLFRIDNRMLPGLMTTTPNFEHLVYENNKRKLVPRFWIETSPEFTRVFSKIVVDRSGSANKSVYNAKEAMRKIAFASFPFEDPKRYARILRAAKWFFNSYAHDDIVESYVQRTICLEILLGEKRKTDHVDQTKLLANRCAYLIGKNLEEREKILRDCLEVDQMRTRILHEGSSAVSGEIHEAYSKLERLCRVVIFRELELVRASEINKVAGNLS